MMGFSVGAAPAVCAAISDAAAIAMIDPEPRSLVRMVLPPESNGSTKGGLSPSRASYEGGAHAVDVLLDQGGVEGFVLAAQSPGPGLRRLRPGELVGHDRLRDLVSARVA